MPELTPTSACTRIGWAKNIVHFQFIKLMPATVQAQLKYFSPKFSQSRENKDYVPVLCSH